jgi:hypothetical protein
MTDAIREFETLVAQHPHAEFHVVPCEMALALLARLTPTPVAPDALAAALAWADMTMNARLLEARRTGTDGDYEDKIEWCIDTLAAAVRELRGENLRLTHESNGRQFRLQQAEAALAALTGRVCATCRHRIPALTTHEAVWPQHDFCRAGQTQCDKLGYTCGAYAAKEPTP